LHLIVHGLPGAPCKSALVTLTIGSGWIRRIDFAAFLDLRGG
jgi:hypothetical protein